MTRYTVFALSLLLSTSAYAQEAWRIDGLDIKYDIQADGSVNVAEAIDVDFLGLERHGIIREIVRRQIFDDRRFREYDITLVGVLNAQGQRHTVRTEQDGDLELIRIGDPNRTLSGTQTYRLAYQLRGVLNAFADHDELYWNATGVWPVPIERASVRVLAHDGIERVDCFQGRDGSGERCQATFTPREAVFTATRALRDGEQMTIVVALRKGIVPAPVPILTPRPRAVEQFFERNPALVASSALEMVAIVGGVLWLWWRYGRDRRFVALQRSSVAAPAPTADAAEPTERIPIFGGRPIGVEFTPPEHIRPGQTGLLLDERADTLDVTATIVDLAVRGYLRITEIDKANWFSRKDWQLERVKPADKDLLAYERIVFDGLFEAGSPTKLSALKNKFYDDLGRAQTALYKDAVERGWFPRNPNTVRILWGVAGIALAGGGVGLTIWLGRWWGAGLLGAPMAIGGVLLALVSPAMPRRTALGQDLTRRTLGFLRYIQTAEVQQQAFAERAQIFTAYLPYAIAFRCVDRWARAFQDIDMQRATASWYAGPTHFNAHTFTSNLGSFSSSLSKTITSTPGGRGGSGFGGSAGGGGGGGGGRSW